MICFYAACSFKSLWQFSVQTKLPLLFLTPYAIVLPDCYLSRLYQWNNPCARSKLQHTAPTRTYSHAHYPHRSLEDERRNYNNRCLADPRASKLLRHRFWVQGWIDSLVNKRLLSYDCRRHCSPFERRRQIVQLVGLRNTGNRSPNHPSRLPWLHIFIS